MCLLANGVCLILGKGRIGNIYPIRGGGLYSIHRISSKIRILPSFLRIVRIIPAVLKITRILFAVFVDRRMLSFTLRILRMLYAELRILRITCAVLMIVDHLCYTQDSLFRISPMRRVVRIILSLIKAL